MGIGQKHRLSKQDERDSVRDLNDCDGREQPSDNDGRRLAWEARRVKATTP